MLNISEKTESAEKAEWIEEHGSNYLRRTTALGYDCQNCYVNERAAFELPGFEADLDNRAKWDAITSPGMKAAEAQALIQAGYDATVVWLTVPHKRKDENAFHFTPCEAIVISGYLGKYTLIRP